MLVGIAPNPLCTASAGCRLRICAKCFYNEKTTEDSPQTGRILGGLCLSGLRFFLGSLFFSEKHLYILLCFHQFLHLIPCLAVGWISGFLLRKQCRVFRVQFFYLWQLFQSGFIKSRFCRTVQCDLLPMFFQKLLAVPSLTVGILHRSCLGVVDDVCPQDGNLRHALLCGLDGIA